MVGGGCGRCRLMQQTAAVVQCPPAFCCWVMSSGALHPRLARVLMLFEREASARPGGGGGLGWWWWDVLGYALKPVSPIACLGAAWVAGTQKLS